MSQSAQENTPFIDAARVQLHARPANKEQAIRAAGNLLVQSGCITSEYVESLLAREAAANTYLGQGVAIPHGEIAARHHIRRTGVAVLQVPDGVQWREGERARLIFAIAAQSDEHLALLRRLTRLLQDPAHIERLSCTTAVDDILQAFNDPPASPSQATVKDAQQADDFADFFDWTVAYPNGLHARPAQQWVQTARGFGAELRVRLIGGARAGSADAKNLIELLQIGAGHGATLRVSAQGADAAAALAALARTMDGLTAQEQAEAAAAAIAALAAQSPASGPRWQPEVGTPSLAGVAASPGLAIGRVRRRGAGGAWENVLAQVVDIPADLISSADALSAALAVAREELLQLAVQSDARLGAGKGGIFRAQAELLGDGQLLGTTCALIAQGHGTAWSWAQAAERSAQTLAALPNAALAARAADLRDVAARVLRHLGGVGHDLGEVAGHCAQMTAQKPRDAFCGRLVQKPFCGEVSPLGQKAAISQPLGEDGVHLKEDGGQCSEQYDGDVIIASDLAPSDTAALNPAQVAALCTAQGGPASHTAIIARTLGLPAVVALGASALDLAEGQTVVVDGDAARLYWNVSAQDLERARQWQSRQRARAAQLAAAAQHSAATADGVRIEVAANANNAAQVAQAIAAGAEGVGLMRTEFLYLEREAAPSLQEQRSAYAAMLAALDGRPLIIRTLDIGGDKQVPYLQLPREENPFLGVRGARLLLRRADLLDTQLRAIYEAARAAEQAGQLKPGALSIMFPMITSVAEVAALKATCDRIRAELAAPHLPLGIMVEVPAAAAMAEQLAAQVDFFSIGTNDLTQYVLAIDRQHPELAAEADSLHPAVLRTIAQTIAGARAASVRGHSCWVGVCGGLAGDPLGAAILAGLGARELSMSQRDIAAVKATLRRHSLPTLERLAHRACACADAASVRALAAEFNVLE